MALEEWFVFSTVSSPQCLKASNWGQLKQLGADITGTGGFTPKMASLPPCLVCWWDKIELSWECRFQCLSVPFPLRSFKESHPYAAAAAAAKSLQSCPTLCDPIDGSPPGSSVHGILHARTLEWVAISSSNAWKWKVKMKLLHCVRFLATPWTAVYQAPPSMGFSRQEDWSGLP